MENIMLGLRALLWIFLSLGAAVGMLVVVSTISERVFSDSQSDTLGFLAGIYIFSYSLLWGMGWL